MRLQKVKFMHNFLRRKTIKIHGHCHQKSLSTMEATFAMLNVPKTVRLLFTIRVVVEWQVLLI
jgi:calcineurin-like phosphoesterase family protein